MSGLKRPIGDRCVAAVLRVLVFRGARGGEGGDRCIRYNGYGGGIGREWAKKESMSAVI
jgi:hypothetical protein